MTIQTSISHLDSRNTFIQGENWFGVRALFERKDWKELGLGSKDYFIFAEDDSGNHYVLDSNETVYFLDHETEELELLCNSLSIFLSRLVPQPKVILKPEQVKSAWIDPDFLKSLENN